MSDEGPGGIGGLFLFGMVDAKRHGKAAVWGVCCLPNVAELCPSMARSSAGEASGAVAERFLGRAGVHWFPAYAKRGQDAQVFLRSVDE